jgi:hypothetical protein
MSCSYDPDDQVALGEIFAGDLRSVFPEVVLSERMVDDHVGAMMSAAQLLAEEGASALEPASHPSPEGLTTPRRKRMRGRMFRRVVAVAAGLLLSLGGLAYAVAFQGSDDPGNDHTTAIVANVTDDQNDQGEDADDQGEDADDQGEDADDQGEDADDQGEDADDQGEDESGDNGSDDQDSGDSDDDGSKDGDGGDSQD